MGARNILIWLLTVLITVSLLECVSVVGGTWIARHDPFVLLTPERNDDVSYDEYLSARDPVLGWPSPDSIESRPTPEFPDLDVHEPCVALYGDSFTRGAEVDDLHAWGNVLSRLLGCRVANYGVDGYGTDQSYLRFKMLDDRASVVILGYRGGDIVRNVTRLSDLRTGKMDYGLKPRFTLASDGELELLPLPKLSENEYLRAVGVVEPRLVLEHEPFQPGGSLAIVEFSFPFSISFLRMLPSFLTKVYEGTYCGSFYRHDHPTRALQITSGIIHAFWRDVVSAENTPLIVIFPSGGDVMCQQKTGRVNYRHLLELLDDSEIDYLDLGPPLMRHLGPRDFREIVKPLGHYNEEVNELVARIVLRQLRDVGITP